jgi:hypothetical protein
MASLQALLTSSGSTVSLTSDKSELAGWLAGWSSDTETQWERLQTTQKNKQRSYLQIALLHLSGTLGLAGSAAAGLEHTHTA